ncbi:MAG: acyl-CoA dehydrogenase [Burkholderiales bacterium]
MDRAHGAPVITENGNMTTSHYSPPLEEAVFLLDRVMDWSDLFARPAFAHADAGVARAVLTEGARFAATVLAPLNRVGDEQGCRLENGRVRLPPKFVAAFREFAAAGWPGLDMPRQAGGQDLPLSVQVAFAEMVNGACVAFGMVPTTMRAGGRLLLEHAEPRLAELIVPKLVSGEWTATICITEAQAGSDVGRIRTRAVRRDDSRYELSGTKIFISFGDHDLTEQIIHLVLARTPDSPPGTQGISLFAVPARGIEDGERNGVSVSRLEKKMGLKASPTCVLDLDRALGWRIGPECHGLRCMFTMVNLMRLEVAIEGVGLAQAATEKALHYALERPQGGRPESPPVMIGEHADVRRMLSIMQARTRAMRALVFETARYLDLARAADQDTERKAARMLAEFLLPVCKTCASEMGFEVSSLAVQVFGGHGYVADTGVEQYVRDSRVMAIYEGTSGIQALDLLARKVLRDGGARYGLFVAAIQRDLERHGAQPDCRDLLVPLSDALRRLQECTAWVQDRAAEFPRDVEAAATDYLQLVGLVACAWMWLRMAAAADAGSDSDRERRRLAHFYMQWLLPQAGVHAARIRLGSQLIDKQT